MHITGKLVEIPAKGEIIAVGDIHGDLESLKYILAHSNFLERAYRQKDIHLVFLGDYGDRGLESPEVYHVVLSLKELFPERVVLMKGNHEGPEDLLAYPHDLPKHLNIKFGRRGANVYSKIRKLFQHFHNAVTIQGRYIFLHGGAPSQISEIGDVAYANEKHPSESHLEEILWNDPSDGIIGTYLSPRGAGRLFGEDVTDNLLRIFNVNTLIRGHEASQEGYKINHNGKVITIFSRKGPPYHNNSGAFLHLNLSRKSASISHLLQGISRF